ncbi:MAG TPA: TolC family protein [Desulfobacteraceae bacterium]|nr:TolC family protein [Desulfobacteraceae bacterium]
MSLSATNLKVYVHPKIGARNPKIYRGEGSMVFRYFRIFSVVLSISFIAVFSGSSSAFGEGSVSSPETERAGLRLSLDDLIKRVHERNERIHYQQLEWGISQDAVKDAKGIFEPQLVTSYLHDKSHIPKTIEDYSSLGFIDSENDTYWKRNNEYNAAVENILPTGAQVRVGYSLKELQSSMLNSSATDAQYQTFVGGSVVQPLLKNAGIGVTMASVRVAEADSDMAMQGYRREMLQVVAEAASAYWNLCLAQEKLKVRRESVRIAGEILRDNRERVRTGKMAQTEVMEAEAGLALRKSLEIAAKQELISAVNNIKTLFSLSTDESEELIVAVDALAPRDIINVDFESSYRMSLKMRPEYISTMRKIEREGIRIAYAENQRWPQLDLKASYGINGLDDASPRGSWSMAKDRDYESWTVGLELRIPLMGGRKAKSELAAAKKRKEQTLLELKATEVALANAVDTSIKNVRNALSQADSYAEAVRLNEHLLKVELARLNAGISNSRLVLDRDEELNRAKEYYLESLVNFEKAFIALRAVQGNLLRNYGIDIMEES